MRSIREVKGEVLSAGDRHSEKSHALISRTAMRIVESRERMERAKSLAASTHASPALQGMFVSRGSAPAFSTLREFTLRYLRERDLHRLLDDTLTAVMVATRADRGNVQMLEARTRTLRIVAQRGFEADFLEFFAGVRAEGACGKAFLLRRRVVVPDVKTHPIFVGQPALEVMLRAGAYAVQSTPIVTAPGQVLGMISTHFSASHRPTDDELLAVDVLARNVATLIADPSFDGIGFVSARPSGPRRQVV